jgi:hypothetical protein
MAVEQLDKGSPDGCVIGSSATELVAFHGATPVDQAAYVALVSTSAPIQSGYGFTVTQATAVISLVNAMQAALVEKGLMAAS